MTVFTASYDLLHLTAASLAAIMAVVAQREMFRRKERERRGNKYHRNLTGSLGFLKKCNLE
jgi:hypothetical protein